MILLLRTGDILLVVLLLAKRQGDVKRAGQGGDGPIDDGAARSVGESNVIQGEDLRFSADGDFEVFT